MYGSFDVRRQLHQGIPAHQRPCLAKLLILRGACAEDVRQLLTLVGATHAVCEFGEMERAKAAKVGIG